jgi:hypothetical protein
VLAELALRRGDDVQHTPCIAVAGEALDQMIRYRREHRCSLFRASAITRLVVR